MNALRCIVLSVVIFTALVADVSAAEFTDRIRTAGGAEAGEITATTPVEISLDKGTAGKVQIPV
ncbi:MAG: hypothetical protein AB7U97_21305, partial [Pirellulales bacterium]